MRTVQIALLFVGLLFSGCKTPYTWSAEAISPDGAHVAKARTYPSGGFGTADGGQTSVDLNWTQGSQHAMDILIIPGGPQAAGEPSVLNMKWIDAKHLQLTYTGHETPIFQAVRCADVEISLLPEHASP
jgi:hypothetical protein